MPTKIPNELLDRWSQAFNDGDLEELLSLYERDAVFFPEPGNRCEGIEQIRASVEAWLAMNSKIEMEGIHLVEYGNLALSKSRWSLSAISPEGEAIALNGIGTEVLRKQADGSWLFAIDDPFGPSQ